MREIDTATHDPDARLPYRWDWAGWLATDPTIGWIPGDDTIATVELIPEGIQIASHDHDDLTVTAILHNPTPGARSASVVCRITTAQGYREDRTLRLHITNR